MTRHGPSVARTAHESAGSGRSSVRSHDQLTGLAGHGGEFAPQQVADPATPRHRAVRTTTRLRWAGTATSPLLFRVYVASYADRVGGLAVGTTEGVAWRFTGSSSGHQ